MGEAEGRGAAERRDDREAAQGADQADGGGGGVLAGTGPGLHGADEVACCREERWQERKEGEEEVREARAQAQSVSLFACLFVCLCVLCGSRSRSGTVPSLSEPSEDDVSDSVEDDSDI